MHAVMETVETMTKLMVRTAPALCSDRAASLDDDLAQVPAHRAHG